MYNYDGFISVVVDDDDAAAACHDSSHAENCFLSDSCFIEVTLICFICTTFFHQIETQSSAVFIAENTKDKEKRNKS